MIVGRLVTDLEVFDRSGAPADLEVDLDEMVRAELHRARSIRLHEGAPGAGRTARLRVRARLAPDGTTGELHAMVSAQVDQGETLPLSWEVDVVRPSSGAAAIPNATYEEALRSALAETVGVLDRQAGVIGSEPSELVAALESPEPPVRVAAAESLGHLRHRPAVEPLCRLLADRNAEVFRATLQALASVRDQRAVPCVIQHATDDPARLEQVIGALTDLGGNEAVAFLEETASEHASPRIRRLAQAGARRIRGDSPGGHAKAHDHEHEIEGSPAAGYIKALTDPEREVRVGAARMLAAQRRREAVEPLCGILSHEDVETSAAALDALVEIGDDRAIPCLVRWAGDNETRLALVVEALAVIGGPNALSVLELMASEHQSPVIRQLAREAETRARTAAPSSGARPH